MQHEAESERARCFDLDTKSSFEDLIRLKERRGSNDIAKRNLSDRMDLVELDVEIP